MMNMIVSNRPPTGASTTVSITSSHTGTRVRREDHTPTAVSATNSNVAQPGIANKESLPETFDVHQKFYAANIGLC